MSSEARNDIFTAIIVVTLGVVVIGITASVLQWQHYKADVQVQSIQWTTSPPVGFVDSTGQAPDSQPGSGDVVPEGEPVPEPEPVSEDF